MLVPRCIIEAMKVIGITGGVGSGKSEILNTINGLVNCRILSADNIAKELEEPGNACYKPLVELLGEDILDKNGCIVKDRMAAKIFNSAELLSKVNKIIHPQVKIYILSQILRERELNEIDYLFLEAALLIEEGYGEIVDEMWYIYTEESVRRNRLKASRGYTDDKIDSIMAKQLSEQEFRDACSVVIDNSGTHKDTEIQLRKLLC